MKIQSQDIILCWQPKVRANYSEHAKFSVKNTRYIFHIACERKENFYFYTILHFDPKMRGQIKSISTLSKSLEYAVEYFNKYL